MSDLGDRIGRMVWAFDDESRRVEVRQLVSEVEAVQAECCRLQLELDAALGRLDMQRALTKEAHG